MPSYSVTDSHTFAQTNGKYLLSVRWQWHRQIFRLAVNHYVHRRGVGGAFFFAERRRSFQSWAPPTRGRWGPVTLSLCTAMAIGCWLSRLLFVPVLSHLFFRVCSFASSGIPCLCRSFPSSSIFGVSPSLAGGSSDEVQPKEANANRQQCDTSPATPLSSTHRRRRNMTGHRSGTCCVRGLHSSMLTAGASRVGAIKQPRDIDDTRDRSAGTR